MREEYEAWFIGKFGFPPMPIHSRVLDFCWAGYQAGVESMNKPVNLSEWQKLVAENAALRHRAYNLQCLLQEYLDLNGDYAATMPKSEWVERVREAVKGKDQQLKGETKMNFEEWASQYVFLQYDVRGICQRAFEAGAASRDAEFSNLRQHLDDDTIEAARQTGYMAGHASRDDEFAELHQQLAELLDWQQKAFAAHPNIDMDIDRMNGGN